MSWTSERARVAALTRSRNPDDPDLVAARTNLKAERLAAYIQRTVAEAPLMSEEQRDRLARLLRPTADPTFRGIPTVGGDR